eukprot:7486189-Pyramimonas_sp.AAC.2
MSLELPARAAGGPGPHVLCDVDGPRLLCDVDVDQPLAPPPLAEQLPVDPFRPSDGHEPAPGPEQPPLLCFQVVKAKPSDWKVVRTSKVAGRRLKKHDIVDASRIPTSPSRNDAQAT